MGITYIDSQDRVNNCRFIVNAPSFAAPVSAYDAEFNMRPVFTPDSPHMLRRTITTVNEMIDWFFTGVPFKFAEDYDVVKAHEVLSAYLADMSKYPADTYSAPVKFYLTKATAFHSWLTREVARLDHYHRVKKTDRSGKKSLLDMLIGLAKPNRTE